jgi:hypothetical protein
MFHIIYIKTELLKFPLQHDTSVATDYIIIGIV